MKEGYSAIYVINIVFQAIFTLLWNIGLALAIGYASVEWLSAPDWIYVPLIIIGVIFGFVSMVRFIIGAMNALDRIESDRKKKIKANGKKNGKKE